MNLSRSALVLCSLVLVLITPALAKPKPEPKEVEYHRSDMNFYWKGDVLKVDSTAVILPLTELTQKGDSYFLTRKKHAPKHIYVEVVNDWIEPITPPNATAPLAIASDAMQIREPQGDVQVALPSAPATYVPATDSMVIPNGAVIKTGADGTAAVLFGGFNSARFIPNSEAAVQQTVAPQLRTTEVDLTKGAVFSKVGQIVGVKQDYKVHTPLGVAAARGTDFVSIALPKRTDVWIAQGTVQLDQVNGKPVGSVTSEGAGGLKIIRYPPMSDPHASMMASSETMTAAMDIIPIINLKVRGLHERMAKGETMTPAETDYMARIKKVPCLIKLTLAEPAPAPKVTPAPDIAPVPPPAAAAIPSAAPAANATAAPATSAASANTPGAAPTPDTTTPPAPATAPSAAATPDATAPPSSPAAVNAASPSDAATPPPAATSSTPPASDAAPTAPPAPTTSAAPASDAAPSPPVAPSATPATNAAPEAEMPATKASATMTPRVEESTSPVATPTPAATLP